MKGFYFFNKRKYMESHLMNMLLASWEITVACNLPGMVRKKKKLIIFPNPGHITVPSFLKGQTHSMFVFH